MIMNAIEIKDLTKRYDSGVDALKGISLSIPKGGFYGLLGPNGAGKSTTIGILCGLLTKTSGTVSINGHNIDTNPSEAKCSLGIVPQEFNFNIFEPCIQTVINHAGFYGVPYKEAKKRATQLLEELGIADKKDTPSGKLSGGMKRRLMIARALAHNPDILILDEPTAGVDISLRRSMWTFLEEQNQKGLTIILTTHYLEEAERLCENIAIIDKGLIIENGPTLELLDKLNSETFVLYTHEPVMELPQLKDILLTQEDFSTLEAILPRDISITSLIHRLESHGITIDRISNKANRLEELFVKLVS